MAKVLIIDDAIFMRNAIKKILVKNGFEIIGEAENGAVGVKKNRECQPDIVTMDITMPEMNGIEALQAIRRYDPKAKIIMISSMGQEWMLKEAILNGAKSFIIKPFKEDLVLKVMNTIAEK
jgi:two-component system chemotaxis response regulator CheY